MQLWEDYAVGGSWRVLLEKVLITLIVTASTYYGWLTWSRWQAEAAEFVHVDLPAQLSTAWATTKTEEEQGPKDEVIGGKIYPRCPADGRTLRSEPIIPATEEGIDHAIARASEAHKGWALTSFSQRRKVLRTLLRYVTDHQEEIATACCLDSGKTRIDAGLGEMLVTAEKLQWTIMHGERALSPSRRPTNLLMSYKRNTVVYEPLGVVAACVSWNYPFHNFISPIISALFAGNAIVVKPSELTCWSTEYFMSFIRASLKVCGHDPELVQCVICLRETADHLTSHPKIKHITFIGSREVAYKVTASAAKALTPVVVELGGKDPVVVLDDQRTVADLQSISSIVMRGFFQSAGQNCIGMERLVALPGVHDILLDLLEPLIRNLRLGSVLLDASAPDMGAMISSRSFDRLESLVQQAVEQGATLHCGGTRYDHPEHPAGHYFLPTLISDVTPDMAIAQTELFAPVCVVMRAANVDDAIRIANSTMYSLGASVFGHSHSDVQKCVKYIRSGNVAVNDFATYYLTSLPFGGRDGSGYGRFGGEEGLRGLSNIKSICEDAPWATPLGIQTRIPDILQYPIDGHRGWAAVQGIVATGYGVGPVARLRGIQQLLSALMGRSR